MFRLIIFLLLKLRAEICVCPTNFQSLSYNSDYSSSDAVFFCAPEQCEQGLKSPKSETTTTTKMTTTCVAIPSTFTEVVSIQSEVCH
jgi:hypothetical protein